MKILVLGDGILGTEVVKQTGWDYISRKKDGFDIREIDSYNKFFIESFDGVVFWKKYDVILNCIAFTNTYSKSKKDNWDINYKGVADLVDYCNKWNIKLVHVSTDYVYTNSKVNSSEEDIPVHGDNWYSYTKLIADAYIELRSNNYLICRETHKPNPFPYDKAWIDQIGNFDYVDVMAYYIIELIKTNATGVFNIGTELKSILNLAKKTNTNVQPAFKPSETPGNTSLNTDKLKKWLYGQIES